MRERERRGGRKGGREREEERGRDEYSIYSLVPRFSCVLRRVPTRSVHLLTVHVAVLALLPGLALAWGLSPPLEPGNEATYTAVLAHAKIHTSTTLLLYASRM